MVQDIVLIGALLVHILFISKLLTYFIYAKPKLVSTMHARKQSCHPYMKQWHSLSVAYDCVGETSRIGRALSGTGRVGERIA
jgi:hypothetical protein